MGKGIITEGKVEVADIEGEMKQELSKEGGSCLNHFLLNI